LKGREENLEIYGTRSQVLGKELGASKDDLETSLKRYGKNLYKVNQCETRPGVFEKKKLGMRIDTRRNWKNFVFKP
jgi:hypothetical protein